MLKNWVKVLKPVVKGLVDISTDSVSSSFNFLYLKIAETYQPHHHEIYVIYYQTQTRGYTH